MEINASSQHALLWDARRAEVMEDPLQVRFEQNVIHFGNFHRNSEKDIHLL